MRRARLTYDLDASCLNSEVRIEIGRIPGVVFTTTAQVECALHNAEILEGLLTHYSVRHTRTVRWPEGLLIERPNLVIPPEDLPGLTAKTCDMLVPFQREGLAYVQRRLGGLAEWPCGTGKTLLGVMFERSYPGRTIVVTRSGTVDQWESQYQDFCEPGSYRLITLDGTRGFVAEPSPPLRFTRVLRLAVAPEALAPRLQALADQVTAKGRRRPVGKVIKDSLRALVAADEPLPLIDTKLSKSALERLVDAGVVEVIDEPKTPGWKPWRVRSSYTDNVVAHHDHQGGAIFLGPDVETQLGGILKEHLDSQRDSTLPAPPRAKVIEAVTLLQASRGLTPVQTARALQAPLEVVEECLARYYAERDAMAREKALDIPPDTEIIVVGWPVLTERLDALIDWRPQTIIFDESHTAKNHKRWIPHEQLDGSVEFERRKHVSASAHALAELDSVHRVLELSATPDPNRTQDLWAQFDLLDTRAHGKFNDWAQRYCGAYQDKFGRWNTKGTSNTPELTQAMRHFRHKVAREELGDQIKAVVRRMVYLDPKKLTQVRVDKATWIAAQRRGASALLELQLSLTAASKHPWLVTRLKETAGEDGEKVVVLTGRRADAEKLGQAFRKAYPDLPCWVAHGENSQKERKAIKSDFIAHEGSGAVLIGTLEAWGEAIDGLQYANRCLVPMLPWHQGKLIQMEGRFERFGADFSTIIEYVVAIRSVDETVLDLVISKTEQAADAMADDELRALAEALEGLEDVEGVLGGMAARLLAAEEARKAAAAAEEATCQKPP